MIPKLSFDIDGVLADFTTPFINIVNRQNGLSLSPDWPTYNAYGPGQLMTYEQWRRAWEEFLDQDQVWATLPVLPQVNLEIMDEMMEEGAFNGYFVTHRRNTTGGNYRDATFQTRKWLCSNGIVSFSGVIASSTLSRATILKQLGVDAHIDDWGEHFVHLRKEGIRCYLIDRSHNQDVDAGEFRVKTVDEFISKALREFDKSSETSELLS